MSCEIVFLHNFYQFFVFSVVCSIPAAFLQQSCSIPAACIRTLCFFNRSRYKTFMHVFLVGARTATECRHPQPDSFHPHVANPYVQNNSTSHTIGCTPTSHLYNTHFSSNTHRMQWKASHLHRNILAQYSFQSAHPQHPTSSAPSRRTPYVLKTNTVHTITCNQT